MALLLAAGAVGCGWLRSVPDRPNIVLVISDDHGWPYFGFMGSAIVQTPHLDELAREGTVFRHGFATSSLCRPSLLSLLTGYHPLQWSEIQQRRRERGEPVRIAHHPTLPRLLSARGYASFQGGKYWEGGYRDGGFSHGTKRDLAREPVPGFTNASGGEGLELGRSTMEPLWEFLDQHREQPFFVWFAPKLPHTPHDAAEPFLRPYAQLPISEEAMRYYANVTRLDDRVGALIAYLEGAGLSERTLVVFVSDNGWEQGAEDHPAVPALGGPRGKGSMYELGYRTPVIFRWPGVIEEGSLRAEVVSLVDLVPTLLDFAGVDPPAGLPGRSLYPLLTGRGGFERRAVIEGSSRVRPPRAVEGARANPNADLLRAEQAYFYRDAAWRYVWYPDAPRFGDRAEDELYRIDRDPFETQDLASRNPELVADYRQRILDWLEEVVREPASP